MLGSGRSSIGKTLSSRVRGVEGGWGRLSRALAVGVVIALPAFAAPSAARDPSRTATEPSNFRFEARLQRTACFGTCPVYSVSVTSRGQVTWHGERYVAATGERTRRITPAAVQRLRRVIIWSGFMDLPPRHGQVGTDLPSQIVTVTIDGRTHTVTNHYPRGRSPAAFAGVVDAIDAEAGTARWVGPRPTRR